jgi:Ni/Co efflux regulator RcnB
MQVAKEAAKTIARSLSAPAAGEAEKKLVTKVRLSRRGAHHVSHEFCYPERMSPHRFPWPLPPDLCQAVAASYTEVAAVQELLSGAMAAADAAAAAAVVADSEAARRKERAEHKRQRKRHRDRGSHNKRTNKRKNLRRSEGRKGRARTRVQMAPVLSQLVHLSRSRQVSRVVKPMNKQARPVQICPHQWAQPLLT